MYVNGVKLVPFQLVWDYLLNVVGLAHWICNDGSFYRGGFSYVPMNTM